MGCRIIVGKDDDGEGIECAVFYDSVTDTCFGVKLNDLEEAQSFQNSVKKDLRQLTHEEFVNKLDKFCEKREEQEAGEKNVQKR